VEERPRLAGMTRLIHRLEGALSLPPRRLEDDSLQTDGYWDLTTRGSPEQILPIQFALEDEEFLRRFLQHVLPRGFPRIRYFGFLANRRRGALLPLCRTLLAVEPPSVPATPAATPILWLCPCCQGPMHVIERLTVNQLREERQSVEHLDSS